MRFRGARIVTIAEETGPAMPDVAVPNPILPVAVAVIRSHLWTSSVVS
ncbi:MAG: hypothetical protein H0U86_02150 [Chloroflexi bacterium]|nr:hypothetical protein [Chloroflexota bacterium]